MQEQLATSPVAMPPLTTSVSVDNNVMAGARPKHTPDSKCQSPSTRGPDSVRRENQLPTEHKDVPPMGVGHILGEGAAIFTDNMETMLAALDQQMALSGETQKPEGSLVNKLSAPRQISSHDDIKLKESEAVPVPTAKVENRYPELYLPVAENYKISDTFHGYMDIMSTDNNQMVLVELTGLSYRYDTTIYAVDQVNGTMYGKFSIGYQVINERANSRAAILGYFFSWYVWTCAAHAC